MLKDKELMSYIYLTIAILAILISLSMKLLVNEIGRLYFSDILAMMTL